MWGGSTIPSRDLPDLVLIRKGLSVVAVTVRGSLTMDGTGVSSFLTFYYGQAKKG